MFFLPITHIDIFFQTKWKISQNPFSLHFPPGASKIPSLWVNDRFSGNKLVQGKSLTRLFVKMSNLSVSGRIRHSSLGKYLQSLSDVDHTLIHSFESQKYLVDILLIRREVEPEYPFKCKYGAIWFSAFSLLKGSVIKTVLPLISVKCRIYVWLKSKRFS